MTAISMFLLLASTVSISARIASLMVSRPLVSTYDFSRNSRI